MRKNLYRLFAFMLALAVLTAPFTYQPVNASPSSPDTGKSVSPLADSPSQPAKSSQRLIVELKSPPLTVWSKTSAAPSPSGRQDLNSPAAQAYVNQLKAEQAAFMAEMVKALPSAAVDNYLDAGGNHIPLTYQVTFNGMAINPGTQDLRSAEKALLALSGVKAVYRDYAHNPDLYASIPLINAPMMWAQVGGQDNAGEGIKLASMDGGVHKDAPMFNGEGYNYPPGFPKGYVSNTNGKIIVSRVYFRDWDPPEPGDDTPWPGTTGTSHGVHTAGIAAGEQVVANYLGITQTISGVAPKAWVMSYRVFYNSVTGDGSFYTAEGIAALEDIARDGADVLNNSWGSGPLNAGAFDPLDEALRNTAASGVFISMSAGNAGPGSGTTDHPSPDYINVAATTTSGTFAAGSVDVSAPAPVPDDLKGIQYAAAGFGAALPLGTQFVYDYLPAGAADPANDTGCNAWPADTFDGKAALIKRGGCEFGVKVMNAEQAGAVFAVVYNNEAGGDELVSMSPGAVGSQVTIGAIFVGNTNGQAMVDWYTAHGAGSQITVKTTALQVGNTPDIVADFSSRGPGVGLVAKPDIAAPGVNILSQGFAPGTTGEARHLGFGQVSGTSMAAPHVAGAGALLRQLHPDWTNAQIKSALMTTSKYLGIFNSDGSPAQPLDMGAGRLDLAHAGDPGVTIDDPSVSFGLVVTGTQETRSFTLTNVGGVAETYNASLISVSPHMTDTFTYTVGTLPGFQVSPASVNVAAGASATISVTFDTAGGTGIGDNMGYLVLQGSTHQAHLPVWARVAPQPSADVLIIDNDASSSLGFPNYRKYYTDALDALGMTYDVVNADANFGNPTTIPEAAVLSSYKAIIYYTGDNFYPNGSFTVSTALTQLDNDRLTEYASNGGILIAMGQDLASAQNSAVTGNGNFLYNAVLGGNWLQDSVSNNQLPDKPVVALADAPPALRDINLDLSGPAVSSVTLTGANEVPPVASTVTGVAHFDFDNNSNTLYYQVNVMTDHDITVTASHIHTGTVGVSGPVLYPLFNTPTVVTDTLTFSGQQVIAAQYVPALLAGDLYINVHTTDHPAGEIRAQVEVIPNGDGANNQLYVDEIAPKPFKSPENPEELVPYMAFLRYPGMNNVQEGIVGMAHRDQPSLERPGTSYSGKSVYTTFGLEGVNNGTGYTSRADLLDHFFKWAMDNPSVTISNTLPSNPVGLISFTADVTSNITGTVGTSFRWDFGDGGGFTEWFPSKVAGHTYQVCGPYTVRVEAIDSWGNHVVGSTDINVDVCGETLGPPTIFLPIIHK